MIGIQIDQPLTNIKGWASIFCFQDENLKKRMFRVVREQKNTGVVSQVTAQIIKHQSFVVAQAL